MVGSSYAESWREVAPQNTRTTARGIAVSALAACMTITGRMSALLQKPRVQVLILHHVFSDEEQRFRNLLEVLRRNHAFIGYREAVSRAQAGGDRVDRPYLAFSFDDGFKNCLGAAAILQEFGAMGCFFVCPSIIGETNYQRVSAFCRNRLELPGRPVEFMSWDDLESLRDAGHEIGGHTMTHPNLAAIPHEQAVDEVRQSFEMLNKRLGNAHHFAWTYGKFSDCTPQIVRAVYECGYMSCASGERGCHGPQRTDAHMPICVRRDHLVAGWPASHARYFLARAAARMSPASGSWPAGWEKIITASAVKMI